MENPDGAQSRLFIIVAIALVALLVVGLVSIALLVGYTRFVAPILRPTVVAEATATPAPSVTATHITPATPTATPTVGPAPTATRVLDAGASPTPGGVSATATPTGGEEMAPTGFGPLEAVVAGFILLVLILFFRRLRLTRRT